MGLQFNAWGIVVSKKKSFNFSTTAVALLALSLMALFQNCGGFKASLGDLSEKSISATDSSGNPIASLNLPSIFDAKISELQWVKVQIDGTGPLTFPEGVPHGAVFDSNARTLYWIPTRGQAGSYKVRVQESGSDKGVITYNVAPVSDETLRNGGPPFYYTDGDVGYIFVHGKGALDRCGPDTDLATYWGSGPETVAPDASNRLIACYDGRKAVKDTAAGVAQQILNAKCGRYNKCIIFTHSMGGLMLEHMFLHTRQPTGTDPDPSMFVNRDLYQAVRDRTLFVVSLASAAGGSDSASIVNGDGPRQLGQEAIGTISRIIGANDDSTKNLVVSYATHVVAPIHEDPGVPFFMIPGFSEKTLAEESGFFGSIFDTTLNSLPRVVFNTNRELALLDSVVLYQARSDGLVDFRSSCGVDSDVEGEGPGRDASLDDHFRYCWNAPKKPNHYVWFLTNLNHYLITGQPYNCRDTDAACVALFPNAGAGTFSMNSTYTGLNAMEVVRQRLATPAYLLLKPLASAQ